MFFEKPNQTQYARTVLQNWAWANPNYTFEIAKPNIKTITLDASGLMADIKRENNVFEK
jgi:hypothetical protein